jgi:restriction endonuclease Mrr
MKSPPQDERRRYWILSALRDNGAAMSTDQTYDAVRELRRKANEPLTPRELKYTRKAGTEPVWKNEIRHATRLMVEDGRMTRPRHGWWGITDRGRQWLDAFLIIDDDPIENDI